MARVDNPNDWPEAQGAFQKEFLDDPEGWPSIGVHVRWRTSEPIDPPWYARLIPGVREGAGLAQVARLAALGWSAWPEGTTMAVWLAADPPRRPTRLLLTINRDDLPADAGDEDAELVGEVALNSTIAVIGSSWRAFPTYSPIQPARRRIRR